MLCTVASRALSTGAVAQAATSETDIAATALTTKNLSLGIPPPLMAVRVASGLRMLSVPPMLIAARLKVYRVWIRISLRYFEDGAPVEGAACLRRAVQLSRVVHDKCTKWSE